MLCSLGLIRRLGGFKKGVVEVPPKLIMPDRNASPYRLLRNMPHDIGSKGQMLS